MDDKIIQTLEQGGLVVHPSDTVYGLLCDATNPEAVKKLFDFKERPAGKPVSIFVSDLDMAKDYVVIDKKTEDRLKEFIPGPYTIVLPSKHKVAKGLESEKGTLGIRIPKYPAILELVKKFGKPVTATSANVSSQPPNYSLDSFKGRVGDGRTKLVTLMVDGGKLPYNKPSTVIDFTTEDLKVLRQGDIKASSSTLHACRQAGYLSKSETSTKKIAGDILKEALNQNQDKSIVFILKGELGAGKTIFAKGLGEALGIVKIISPTYVIFYEYPIKNISHFVHVDLYNVGDKDEFKHLGLEKYFKAGNIICIEWGEKAGEIIDELKEKVKLVYVDIKHKSEEEREIKLSI